MTSGNKQSAPGITVSKPERYSVDTNLSLEIPIPKPEEKIQELCDASRELMREPVPLNRTESRLPSLQDMLRDEELRQTVLLKGCNQTMLVRLADAFGQRDKHDRFRLLKQYVSDQVHNPGFSAAKLPEDAQRIFVDMVCLYARQQITKTVEYLRSLDQKLSGENFSGTPGGISSNPTLYKELQEAPSRFTVSAWAFVSVCLAILRNAMNGSPAIQSLVWEQAIPQVLLQRCSIITIVYGIAEEKKKSLLEVPESNDVLTDDFVTECANVLPKNVLTFLSNIMADRDDHREQLWPLMWPDAYWVFAFMAGRKFLDPFCLLLQTHTAQMVSKDNSIKDTDPPALRQLKADFMNLSMTEAQAKRAGYPDELKSGFADLYAYTVLLVSQKLSTKAKRQERSRHATITGKAIQAEAVAEEWFALFQLKLLSLGDGRAVRLLCSHLSNHPYEPQLPCSLQNIQYLEDHKVPSVSNSPGAELGSIFYALAEYAKTPGDTVGKIESGETAQANMKSKSEAIFGRKWNLIKRSFLSSSLFDYVVEVFCDSAVKVDEKSPKLDKTTIMVRPSIKCLLEMVLAPEIRGKMSRETVQELWDRCWTLLRLNVNNLLEYVSKINRAPQEELAQLPFVKLCNIYSPRDLLQLIAALATVDGSIRNTIGEQDASTVLHYQLFQDIDIGCEQASILCTKVLTENCPHAVDVFARVKSKAPRSELTATTQ